MRIDRARLQGATGLLRVKLSARLIVCSILLISFGTWLQGNAWGQPYGFHSDELRYLTRTVDDPAIPFWTIYGRWPVYFQKAAAGLIGAPASDLVLARTLSMLASLLGLTATMLAARQLAGWGGALAAVALLAGAPVVVQSAHFFITDVWLFAGIAASIGLSYRIMEHGRWLDSIGLGLAWGIATGSKMSGLFLLPAVGLAHLFSPASHRWLRLTAACMLAGAVALLGQPTLLVHGLQSYLYDGALLHHLDVAAGRALPAYNLQFADTPAWIYYFTHLFPWGAGPALLALGVAGGALAVIWLIRHRRAWRARRSFGLLTLTGAALLAFYLMSAGQHSKYTRYLLPLLPPFAILAGWVSVRLVQKIRPSAQKLAIGSVVAMGLLPGWMYAQIYTRPDTRLQAAAWIGDNVPAQSVICHEPDVGFAVPPIGLGGPAYGETASRNYQGVLLNWGLLYSASDYARSSPVVLAADAPELDLLHTQEQQRQQIEAWLAGCDWMILSDRFADQYMPLAQDFQAISEFYLAALSGRRSDFEQVAEFRSLPSLLNSTIDDRASELTFRSFDHPSIWIFRRH